jgi:Protein of unknown function (DUF4238)
VGTVQQTSHQHLVSKVILKQFTMPGPRSGGWQLLPFDLHHPERHHKPKTTKACGWAENFVAFESASAEQLWCDVERRVPAALAAIRGGTPFADPAHAEALRDLVVLHYVRSYRYREVHVNAFEQARANLSGTLADRFPGPLYREALRTTGLHLTDPGALATYAERLIAQSTIVQDNASGKLFRTSIEDTFHKVQQMASKWRVEIHTPQSGRFLIGDNPGVTIRQDGSTTEYGMAFGDATSMVLPIGPGHLVALGPQNKVGTLDAVTVETLNTMQILAANRYVYMHLRSGLEAFTAKAARKRPPAS